MYFFDALAGVCYRSWDPPGSETVGLFPGLPGSDFPGLPGSDARTIDRPGPDPPQERGCGPESTATAEVHHG